MLADAVAMVESGEIGKSSICVVVGSAFKSKPVKRLDL
jgi:hypothetical protein